MKKTFGIALVLLTLSLSGCLPKKQPELGPAVSTEKQEVGQQLVDVVIDFGENKVATTSGIEARTAFEALIKAADGQGWEVGTKEYDFGVFVESIDNKAGEGEAGWFYLVNGSLPNVAADKYELGDGDLVEWKYGTPEF